jgi:hypothetical protein
MNRADQDRLDALNRSLTNQAPSPTSIERIENLRETAKDLGEQIIAVCPDTRERSLALTHLEETVMWAVKSIVLHQAKDLA